jgi:DNA-binding MarR family transcriptional regulator
MTTDLRAELRQTKPFASLEHEATLSIARTAAILEHGVAEALRGHGITPTQYNVLRILRGAGPGGLCRNEVGERLLRAVPDVTRLLDRLTDLHLIGRQRSDEDRRLVRTHITPKGLALLAELDAPIRAFHRKRLEGVSRQKLQALVTTLAEVRTSHD